MHPVARATAWHARPPNPPERDPQWAGARSWKRAAPPPYPPSPPPGPGSPPGHGSTPCGLRSAPCPATAHPRATARLPATDRLPATARHPGHGPPGFPTWAWAPPVTGSGRFRAQSFGELLDSTFTVYRRKFLPILAITALFQLPYLAVEYFGERSPFATISSHLRPAPAGHLGGGPQRAGHADRRPARRPGDHPRLLHPADAARPGRGHPGGQRRVPRPSHRGRGGPGHRPAPHRQPDRLRRCSSWRSPSSPWCWPAAWPSWSVASRAPACCVLVLIAWIVFVFFVPWIQGVRAPSLSEQQAAAAMRRCHERSQVHRTRAG